MKKLLLASFVVFAYSASAQILQSNNFDEYLVGNVGTVITGLEVGQDGWFTFSNNGTAPTTSTNAENENFQIVVGGNSGLGLQLVGPDGDKGARYMWKDGIVGAWASRTLGNNIVEVEVDINPGDGTSTSRNTFGVYVFNPEGTRILTGFAVRAATRELFLVAYSTPTGSPVGNYNYSLAAAPGVQLPAGVFSRIGVSYNKTTGQVIIKAPGIDPAGLTLAGSAPNTDPGEVDFISFSGNTQDNPNFSSFSMILDNLTVKASATDTLLSFGDEFAKANFSIYPNPATDIFNIDSSSAIENITITDLNGRTVKNINVNSLSSTEVNISDLTTGMYFVTVTTDLGSGSTKILKN